MDKERIERIVTGYYGIKIYELVSKVIPRIYKLEYTGETGTCMVQRKDHLGYSMVTSWIYKDVPSLSVDDGWLSNTIPISLRREFVQFLRDNKFVLTKNVIFSLDFTFYQYQGNTADAFKEIYEDKPEDMVAELL